MAFGSWEVGVAGPEAEAAHSESEGASYGRGRPGYGALAKDGRAPSRSPPALAVVGEVAVVVAVPTPLASSVEFQGTVGGDRARRASRFRA